MSHMCIEWGRCEAWWWWWYTGTTRLTGLFPGDRSPREFVRAILVVDVDKLSSRMIASPFFSLYASTFGVLFWNIALVFLLCESFLSYDCITQNPFVVSKCIKNVYRHCCNDCLCKISSVIMFMDIDNRKCLLNFKASLAYIIIPMVFVLCMLTI